jgi:hypothetical protein
VKLLVPILLAMVVLGGTVIGLGYARVINIPGITPPKKQQPEEVTGAEKPEQTNEGLGSHPTPQPPPSEVAQSTPPPAQPQAVITERVDGTERLAKLWSSMDTDALVKVLDQWNDGDVLRVLARMDDKKLAELLSELAPDKAARISMGIKSLEKGGK